MNQMKTFILLALLTILLVWIGSLVGGRNGAVFALVFAGVMNFGVYWFSDRIDLKMYRAQAVTEAQEPKLHRIVRELALRGGIPMPKVYVIPQDAPNAFATGRNPQHAAVAVTTGIKRLLNEEELKGVLAHELSHIRPRDILIQLAISRSREYHADEGGAQLAGNPLYLARALAKLDAGTKRIPMKVNPSTAHMFIVSPLTRKGVQGLFSTHPPIEKRIKRLEHMAHK